MAKFDARANLYSVVRSILAGDKPGQELLDDAAVDALERLKAREGESVELWTERLVFHVFDAPVGDTDD